MVGTYSIQHIKRALLSHYMCSDSDHRQSDADIRSIVQFMVDK